MKYAIVRMPEGRIERLAPTLDDASEYVAAFIRNDIRKRHEDHGYGNAVSNTYQVQELLE